MELYLDSVDFKEIEAAFDLGFLYGLTTTPTFMHKHGITNVDEAIVKLSNMVPILHVEALGDTAEEIVKEAHRLLNLGLSKEKTVFKIPVSNQGLKACNLLRKDGIMVNVHLIYTLNQAYMSMCAGANYLCILAGRFQDQGHDSLTLISQTVEMVERWGSDSKVMFSSVRHAEHVRNSIELGAHAVTIPWGVMKKLNENVFTEVGTNQFVEHTKLLTMKVKEILRDSNPIVNVNQTVTEALIQMTESGLGAVSVVNQDNKLLGIFTDGDLRRKLKEFGSDVASKSFADFEFNEPLTISNEALLFEAVDLFKSKKVDNIIVIEADRVVGILDIQDLVKHNLIG